MCCCRSITDVLQNSCYLLLKSEGRGIDFHGIISLFQGGDIACRVDAIPCFHIFPHLFQGNLFPLADAFIISAPGTCPGICCEKELEISVRKNDSSQISSFQDNIAVFRNIAKELTYRVSYFFHGSYFTDPAVYAVRPDIIGDICFAVKDTGLRYMKLKTKTVVVQYFNEPGAVLIILEIEVRKTPVHGPAVDIIKAGATGNFLGCGTFSGACRTIYYYDQ